LLENIMDMLVKQRLDQLAAPRRNRYFYGKLLDELHLTMEQDYLNGKRWMLNRLSLGTGVLSGLDVTPDGKLVSLSPGVAIDAYGREIIVPAKVSIDPSKISAVCDTVRDRDPATESQVYVLLCYRECKADFEPVLVTDCQPQEQCEASTIVEGYCVRVTATTPTDLPPHNDALCDALKNGTDAADKRKRITAALAQPYPGITGDVCVVLATINLATDGTVTSIDEGTAREQVFSNEVLFELLLCLQDGGQGGDGPPGLGLDATLPKILDIAWKHQNLYSLITSFTSTGTFGDFALPFYDGSEPATEAVLTERILSGQNPPLFTIYFNQLMNGIDSDTFTVKLKFELMTHTNNTWTRPGIAIELPLAGTIIQTPGNATALTPNTSEAFAAAASFIPRPEFFSSALFLLLLLTYAEHLSAPDDPTLGFVTLNVCLKGDFIITTDADHFEENQVLDADNIGGLVGLNRTRKPPIQGGKNPSGNLTQGGDFESWVRVTLLAKGSSVPAGAQPSESQLSEMVRMSANIPANAASLPVSINFATAAQLRTAGFSESQAAKVVELRKAALFRPGSDLATRTKFPAQALRKIQNNLILL
jgi:hypothetical protein